MSYPEILKVKRANIDNSEKILQLITSRHKVESWVDLSDYEFSLYEVYVNYGDAVGADLLSTVADIRDMFGVYALLKDLPKCYCITFDLDLTPEARGKGLSYLTTSVNPHE